jgi:hypothetical protein
VEEVSPHPVSLLAPVLDIQVDPIKTKYLKPSFPFGTMTQFPWRLVAAKL